MDSDTSLDIANLKALIGLRQEEERRLRSIIFDVGTASQVRIQAQTKLIDTLRDIQFDMEELTSLEATIEWGNMSVKRASRKLDL